MNNSTAGKNGTQLDQGKDAIKRPARSHLSDTKNSPLADQAKNASSPHEDQDKNGTQRFVRHHPTDDKNMNSTAGQAKNASSAQEDQTKNATKRSVPVLVVEHVQFIPLDKHLNTTTDSSSEDDLKNNQRRSDNSLSPQLIPQNSTQQNSTKNVSSGGDRVISPKFAHMFHNMFAG